MALLADKEAASQQLAHSNGATTALYLDETKEERTFAADVLERPKVGKAKKKHKKVKGKR